MPRKAGNTLGVFLAIMSFADEAAKLMMCTHRAYFGRSFLFANKLSVLKKLHIIMILLFGDLPILAI